MADLPYAPQTAVSRPELASGQFVGESESSTFTLERHQRMPVVAHPPQIAGMIVALVAVDVIHVPAARQPPLESPINDTMEILVTVAASFHAKAVTSQGSATELTKEGSQRQSPPSPPPSFSQPCHQKPNSN